MTDTGIEIRAVLSLVDTGFDGKRGRCGHEVMGRATVLREPHVRSIACSTVATSIKGRLTAGSARVGSP